MPAGGAVYAHSPVTFAAAVKHAFASNPLAAQALATSSNKSAGGRRCYMLDLFLLSLFLYSRKDFTPLTTMLGWLRGLRHLGGFLCFTFALSCKSMGDGLS